MQTSRKLTLSASSSSDSAKISEEFSWKMTLNGGDGGKAEELPPYNEETEDEEEEEEEEDFSFAFVAGNESPISADDVFQNGQIKPIFPLFDQSLLFAADPKDGLPSVKKVFVEAKEDCPTTSEAAEGVEGAADLFCGWSGKAAEASPQICKKSNSTGFSKLWRFRDLLHRSNSDGKDAFVFLNGSSSRREEEKELEKSEVKAEKKAAGGSKTTSAGEKVKVKKGAKVKTASSSAHEMHYVRNRAMREGDRRRTFLPYRPEVVGFFTNVQGGLSRNVHPF